MSLARQGPHRDHGRPVITPKDKEPIPLGKTAENAGSLSPADTVRANECGNKEAAIVFESSAHKGE